MYDDLTEDGVVHLACKHLNRGQKIPAELMAVLKELGVAYYFEEEPDESAAEATAPAGA